MTTGYRIREATPADLEAIVAFTLAEAHEAEGAALTLDAAVRGVRAGLTDRTVAAYWVAEAEDATLAASTSIVTEWSNFHGGRYWWVQSLYIAPDHRGHGLADRLLDRLSAEARAAGALDLRLYARANNPRALRVYERCGFATHPVVVMRKPLGDPGTAAGSEEAR